MTETVSPALGLMTADALQTALRGGTPPQVLDCSWYLDGRSGAALFEAGHIPGARHIDIDRVCDPQSPLPHMLPPTQQLAQALGDLGLRRERPVVLYDQQGLFAAPRVGWMLQIGGFDDVAILDGGLPAWLEVGGSVDTGPNESGPPVTLEPVWRPARLIDRRELDAALNDPRCRVLDARPPERFQGLVDEPRPGLRRGHMPGAVNVPFRSLLTDDGRLLPVPDLAARFAEVGLKAQQTAILSCGSGVTAAILGLALDRIGHTRWRLYDGSWAEFGAEFGAE